MAEQPADAMVLVCRRHWHVLPAVVVAALLTHPAPVHAQSRGRCEAGGSVGASTGAGGIVGFLPEAPQLTVETRVDETSNSFGFWIGCDVSRFVGLEFAMPILSNDQVGVARNLNRETSINEMNANIFLLGRGLVYLYPGRVAPYVAVGGGILPNIDFSRVGPTLTLSAGAKVYVTRRLFVRAEFTRYAVTFRDELSADLPDVLVRMLYEDRQRFTDVNIGLGVRW